MRSFKNLSRIFLFHQEFDKLHMHVIPERQPVSLASRATSIESSFGDAIAIYQKVRGYRFVIISLQHDRILFKNNLS